MLLAWMLYGLSTLLFGVVPNFWVYLGVMVFCGLSMPIYNTPAMTLIQTGVPSQLMGRVFSVMMMINGISMPLGTALFGPVGDAVSIELLLIVTGIMLLAGGIILRGRRQLFLAGGSQGEPNI